MSRISYRLSALGVLALALIALAGCSEGVARKNAGTSAKVVVATVAGRPISEQALAHRMAIVAVEDHVSVPETPRGPRYEKLQRQALGYLISAQWQIAEATAEGRPVSEGAARTQLRQIESKLFPNRALLQSFFKTSRKTVADLLLETEANDASTTVHEHIAESVPKLTSAMIASYYETHLARYRIPERRDLKILRTATETEALKAKREVSRGASFARLAGKSRIAQPIFTREGLALGVVNNFYKEKALNDAIFTAKPNVLMGPVRIYLGYYIFEVKRIRPSYQEGLAEARNSIRQQLPAEMLQRNQLHFIASWRARWRARTSCTPGYVMAKCRQYKGYLSEDPTALE